MSSSLDRQQPHPFPVGRGAIEP